jgi:hypothetical protein
LLLLLLLALNEAFTTVCLAFADVRLLLLVCPWALIAHVLRALPVLPVELFG